MDELEFFSQFVTPRRLALIGDKLQHRTRYFTVVLEDIFQTHNASAVLRTCDCFGIQDVYFLQDRNTYEISPQVSMGSGNWLDIHRIETGSMPGFDSISFFREKGYKIVATTPHGKTSDLEAFVPGDGPYALFFGTELQGLSNKVIEEADYRIKIPMVGFTESLNLSVSVGVILHHLSWKLRQSSIPFGLSDDEKANLKVKWLKATIKRPDLLERYFKSKAAGNSD